jgi:hypothetical protein
MDLIRRSDLILLVVDLQTDPVEQLEETDAVEQLDHRRSTTLNQSLIVQQRFKKVTHLRKEKYKDSSETKRLLH